MKKKNWLILAMAFGLVAPTYASEKVVATTNIVEGVPTKATVVSCQMRATDPTVLDVVYNVESKEPYVKVRALAFKDGKRDFGHVIRPETWVDGTETNLGDHIAANVNHKLSWKVTADWQTDVGNLSFEVLSVSPATNVFVMPFVVRTETHTQEVRYVIDMPGWVYYVNDGIGDFDVRYGSERDYCNGDATRLSCLLWYYADWDPELRLESGILYWDKTDKTSCLSLSYWDGSQDIFHVDDVCVVNGVYNQNNNYFPVMDIDKYAYTDYRENYLLSRRKVFVAYLKEKLKRIYPGDWQISYPVRSYH